MCRYRQHTEKKGALTNPLPLKFGTGVLDFIYLYIYVYFFMGNVGAGVHLS